MDLPKEKSVDVLRAEYKQSIVDEKQAAWNRHRLAEQMKARNAYHLHCERASAQLKTLRSTFDSESKALALHVANYFMETKKDLPSDAPFIVQAQARILKACVEMVTFEIASRIQSEKLWQGVIESDKIPFAPTT